MAPVSNLLQVLSIVIHYSECCMNYCSCLTLLYLDISLKRVVG